MAVSTKPRKPAVPGMPRKTSQGLGSLAVAMANMRAAGTQPNTGLGSLTVGLANAAKGANMGLPTATSTPPPPAPNRRLIEADPVYQQQMAGAIRNRDSAFTDIDTSRGNTLRQFGYTASFNPDQSLVAGSLRADPVDPNNPFSRAALLKRAYDNRKRGNETSYAARGQQFAGSMVNARNQIDLDNLQSEDSLTSQLAQLLANLFTQRRKVGVGFDTDAQTIAAQALQRAVQETNQ